LTKPPTLRVVPDYGRLDPEPLSLARIEAMIVDEPGSTTTGAPRLSRPAAPRRTAPRAPIRSTS
jgi:hypothetical protein